MTNANINPNTTSSVTSRVVGSSNPITKKFNSIGKAISGVGFGFIAVALSFGLIWYSLNGVDKNSAVVANLDLLKPQEVVNMEGMIKVAGVPVVDKSNDLVLRKCSDLACTISNENVTAVTNAIYYEVKYQRFEVKKEVETTYNTRIENGVEIEDKIETPVYKEDWIDKAENTLWTDFTLGNVKVFAETAQLFAEKKETTYENIVIPNFIQPVETYGQTVSSLVGSTRAVVTFIPVDTQEYIVVGDLVNGQIKSGEPFVVTTKSDTELIRDLENSENSQKKMFMVISWFAAFIGFSMIFAPIIELVSWIPLFGGAAKASAGVLSFILASIIVLMGYLFIKFWYVFVILLVVIFALAIFLLFKKLMSKKKE